MKKDIHPKYHDITFVCSCGAKFVAGSVIKEDYKTEICSNCHPFYTGKQKLLDTSGRVDKFMAKVKKAEAIKETKKAKKTKKSKIVKITTEEREAEEQA
jgi:large subunit ribosomal protein L31